jgi:hypothetical protein
LVDLAKKFGQELATLANKAPLAHKKKHCMGTLLSGKFLNEKPAKPTFFKFKYLNKFLKIMI